MQVKALQLESVCSVGLNCVQCFVTMFAVDTRVGGISQTWEVTCEEHLQLYKVSFVVLRPDCRIYKYKWTGFSVT